MSSNTCSTYNDFKQVYTQCLDMLQDRGHDVSSIPDMPPKTILMRIIKTSHESGYSPMLDITHETNPILFLYQSDIYKQSATKIVERIVNTIHYHSLSTINDITIVNLGPPQSEVVLEAFQQKLSTIIENFQIYHWKTLMIPIQKHFLVPKHTIVPQEKHDDVLEIYKLTNKSQLPAILVSDPMARHLFLKIGDIVHIDRQGTSSYRVCIEQATSE